MALRKHSINSGPLPVPYIDESASDDPRPGDVNALAVEGTPTGGNIPIYNATTTQAEWGDASAGGAVTSVTAGNANITIGGTVTAPTVRVTAGTFDASGAAATAQTNAISAATALVDDLSGVTDAPTARTNLGLGTAATQATGAFDSSGAAASAQTAAMNAAIALVDDLSGVTNVPIARTNLGLGTAAVINTGYSSGSLPLVSSGTPDGTKFLRDDGVWASIASGGSFNVLTKTALFTAAHGDVILADTAAGDFTITLPVATNNSALVVVKKVNSTNTVTIAPAAGTIDGAANVSISVQNNSFTFVSDGTNWFII